jgi:hypothetical protein
MKAVPQCIEFEILDGVRWKARAREHVMPLQNLVQDDAVEKTTKAEPEDAG